MKRDPSLKVTLKSPAEMMVAVQYVDSWLIKLIKHAKMMVSYWLFYLECMYETIAIREIYFISCMYMLLLLLCIILPAMFAILEISNIIITVNS